EQRAVNVERRAEIAKRSVEFGLELLLQGDGQARFADARLARDQHHSALALASLPPAPLQHLELLLATDEGRRPQVAVVEQPADQPPGALRDDQTAGFSNGSQAVGKSGSLADGSSFL